MDLVISAVFGALGGAAVLLLQRRLTARDRQRDMDLKAISDSELAQKSLLDRGYFEAIGDKARRDGLDTILAARPWPDGHADLLGPDRDRVLDMLGTLIRKAPMDAMDALKNVDGWSREHFGTDALAARAGRIWKAAGARRPPVGPNRMTA